MNTTTTTTHTRTHDVTHTFGVDANGLQTLRVEPLEAAVVTITANHRAERYLSPNTQHDVSRE